LPSSFTGGVLQVNHNGGPFTKFSLQTKKKSFFPSKKTFKISEEKNALKNASVFVYFSFTNFQNFIFSEENLFSLIDNYM
jgi:hypothetical protein